VAFSNALGATLPVVQSKKYLLCEEKDGLVLINIRIFHFAKELLTSINLYIYRFKE
jgi:hypothetical protein